MSQSNFPGYMIVSVDEAGTTANLTFNEVANYAKGDGLVFFKVGSVKLFLSDEPASHMLTFGNVTVTYSDDDGHTVTVDDSANT